jgi:hypothetical protein
MAAEGIKRTFIQDGLRDALQALAAPGDVALALVPDGTVKADENSHSTSTTSGALRSRALNRN